MFKLVQISVDIRPQRRGSEDILGGAADDL